VNESKLAIQLLLEQSLTIKGGALHENGQKQHSLPFPKLFPWLSEQQNILSNLDY
jgi:hypothetical protein